MSNASAAGAGGAPGVFTRKSSGLVRAMSPNSAIIYNILTMGIIFPWTFLEAPTAVPGGNLVWGIVVAFLLELPLALSYAWLASALPRSGGDYVFQSRTFGGGFGFTVVFGLFVIWILQWVALSGWLMSTIGIAPLAFGLAHTTGAGTFTDIGTWASTPHGIIIVSILNALVSMILLVSGFKNYVRFQLIIFASVILSFVIMLVLFFTHNQASFQTHINAFAQDSAGVKDFFNTASGAATKAGVNLHPPFSLWATLMVAPIAWTSLQWATYSVEQGSEVKNAASFKTQAKILVVSLAAVAVLLILLALGLRHGIGEKGMQIASSGYWYLVGEATLNGASLMPNLLAMTLTGSSVLVFLIGLGYILNSFQIVCNCYIGCTRILVAQALDGLLPRWFADVSSRFRTPVNAHLAYFLASIPVIVCYNTVADWSTKWALAITFANGAALTISGLAAALLPHRNRAIYEASPGSKYKVGNVPLVTIVGGLGFVCGALMCLAFLFNKDLGLAFSMSNPAPYLMVLATLILAAVTYLLMKSYRRGKGVDVRYAFAEIPPE
jgi:basic amino acid/polyamine antiporter, APA family